MCYNETQPTLYTTSESEKAYKHGYTDGKNGTRNRATKLYTRRTHQVTYTQGYKSGQCV